MLFALEGPDRCGKSSLFHELQKHVDACFVPSLPTPKAVFPLMSEFERRQAALWRALYDEGRTYISDRHVSISAPVYDTLYRRQTFDLSWWHTRVNVIYLRVSAEELRRRHAEAGDELFDEKHYEAVLDIYQSVIRRFKQYIVLDGMRPTSQIAQDVALYIRSSQ